MKERPVISIPLNKADKFLEICSFLLLISAWVIAGYGYSILPETIPTHFDLQGKINGYGNKLTVFILPFIAVLLYVLLTWMVRFPQYFNYLKPVTPENAKQQYTAATAMIRWLKAIILLVFVIITADIVLTASGRKGIGVIFFLLPLAILIVPYIFIVKSVTGSSQKQK
ncbi:DUF1648 domain-containing protein [Chitinophagaceae bacterium MMS25-I14]